MKKAVNFRPTFFTAIAVISSIVSAYFIFVARQVFVGVAIAALLSVIFFFLPISICAFSKKDKLKTAIIFSAAVILLSSVAFLRFYSIAENYKKANLNDPFLTAFGKVEQIFVSDYGKSLVLTDVEFSGRIHSKNGYKISVIVYGENEIDVGDKITFSAVVRDQGLFYEGKFLAADLDGDIKYSVYVNSSEINVIGRDKSIFETVNTAIRDTLKSGLGEDEFTVAYALICGNSEYSGSEILYSYRSAGVAHIFAVSGLHIGFLATILGFILRKTRLNPFVSAAIIIPVLFFYSGVCGFTSSSLRATVMCGVSLFVTAFGGRYDGLSSLSFAAIIIALISPVQVFCAGFVLSFSVVFGIITVAKPIGKLFRFLPAKISSALGVVFSAWLFSAPILMIFFGEVSLFAVISNLIFIPVVGAIYVFLIVSLILSFFSPTIFLFLPNIVLSAVNYVMTVIDYEIFTVGGITLTATTAFYYLALILFGGLINLNRVLKASLYSAFALIFLFTTVAYNLGKLNEVKAYAIGSYGICATVAEGRSQRAVIVSYAEKGFPINRIQRVIKAGEKITDVVILSNIDVNTVITRLNAITTVRRVYFFSANQNAATLKNSFKYTEFSECGEGLVLSGDFDVIFKAKGQAAEISAKGKSALVFSEIGDNALYVENEANKNYDLLVAYDYLERIAALYSHDKFLSYRNSPTYENAERSGNFMFKFA